MLRHPVHGGGTDLVDRDGPLKRRWPPPVGPVSRAKRGWTWRSVSLVRRVPVVTAEEEAGRGKQRSRLGAPTGKNQIPAAVVAAVFARSKESTIPLWSVTKDPD